MNPSLAAFVLAAAVGLPQAAPPDAAALQALDSAARHLARAGKQGEMDEAVAALAQLGHAEAAMKALRAACAKELAAKPSPAAAVEAAREIRSAVKSLAKKLNDGEGAARNALAAVLVALDDTCDAAHQQLGHVRVDDEWLAPEDVEARERRSAIADGMRRARAMPADVQTDDGRNATIQAVYGIAGASARAGTLEVVIPGSQSAARDILQQAMRGSAFATFVATGKLQFPNAFPTTYVVLDSESAFRRALADSIAKGGVDAKAAERAERVKWYDDKRGWSVRWALSHSLAVISLFCELAQNYEYQACLEAGRLSWTARTYYGGEIPIFAWFEDRMMIYGNPAGTTALSPQEAEAREGILHFTRGGIAGGREWLQYLVRRHEDPPFENSMVDLFGEIGGNNRLKCTYIFDYLLEKNRAAALLADTRRNASQNLRLGHKEILERALGRTLAQFDSEFRAWLLREKFGLVQRLEGRDQRVEKEHAELLDELNRVRAKSFNANFFRGEGPVDPDRETSVWARKHARYLLQNRDQIGVWPLAHEEFLGRPGFSPDGAWSGSHSLIAGAARNPKEALEQWLSTFYHRLPLVRPGLLRAGYAHEDDLIVFDVETYRTLETSPYSIAWPYPNQTDVPTRMVPESPNPVPTNDQGVGYPITLTVGVPEPGAAAPSVAMTLFEGADAKTAVDCWFSTPDEPTNPQFVPHDTYCLIPKKALKPATDYNVVAAFKEGKRILRWRFRTGQK